MVLRDDANGGYVRAIKRFEFDWRILPLRQYLFNRFTVCTCGAAGALVLLFLHFLFFLLLLLSFYHYFYVIVSFVPFLVRCLDFDCRQLIQILEWIVSAVCLMGNNILHCCCCCVFVGSFFFLAAHWMRINLIREFTNKPPSKQHRYDVVAHWCERIAFVWHLNVVLLIFIHFVFLFVSDSVEFYCFIMRIGIWNHIVDFFWIQSNQIMELELKLDCFFFLANSVNINEPC